MANLSVTADVTSNDTTSHRSFQTGEIIDAGEAFILVDDVAYLADANDTTLDTCDGISLTSAPLGGYITGASTGSIVPGVTGMTIGQLYYLSATPGKIAPFADLTTLDQVHAVYRATSTTEVELELNKTGTIL